MCGYCNNKPGLVWNRLFQSCRPSDSSATRLQPLAPGPSSQTHQEKTTDSGLKEGMSPCYDFFHSGSIGLSQESHGESRYIKIPKVHWVDIKEIQLENS